MDKIEVTPSSGCVFLDLNNCPINDLIAERDQLKDAVKEGKRLLIQSKGIIQSKNNTIAEMRATYADIDRYKKRQKEKRNKLNRRITKLKEDHKKQDIAFEKVMKVIYNELNCSVCPISNFCNHNGKCIDMWKKYLEQE